MFYDLFKKLCDDRNISVSKACIEIGLSRSIAAKWKIRKPIPVRMFYQKLQSILAYQSIIS